METTEWNARPSQAHERRRGGALLISLVAVVVLSGLSGALLTMNLAAHKERQASARSVKALYTAEAGLSHAMSLIEAQVMNDPNADIGDFTVGTAGAPQAFGGGSYAVIVDADDEDESFVVTSTGNGTVARRTIQAVVQRTAGGIFSHALFAGNSSGDPNYTLRLSGEGTQGDQVTGDVYSGGDIEVVEDAGVDGTLRATGAITGASGDEGNTQPIPDIEGMDYANNSDVDVLQEFLAGDARRRDRSAGGRAWELPESYAAHIFRMDPSDRRSEYQSTPKRDFFLEDPYEPVGVDSSQDGSDPYTVTLSGGSEPGPDGNGLVYFVDGNLWLHNRRSYSFMLAQPGGADALRVTFVVKGNIYFSDNFFLQNPVDDGVAFIAINDDQYQDSGNIYFGDPSFGTLRNMNAFMYAQNDFYDYSLDAEGSATVEVNGNMTAGNQVQITRDFEDQHSKLTVNLDDRIMTGQITLPGLPSSADEEGFLRVASWREVPNP